MRLKVTFREYTPPYIDPDIEEERGEYMGSFSEEIEGNTPADILASAYDKAEKYSKNNKTDVRVWETEVVVTPRGIASA